MRFHDPIWIWGFLLIPVLGFVSWKAIKFKTSALHRFISADSAKRLVTEGISRKRTIRSVMLICAAALVLFALARPQYGVKPTEVKRSGIDLMILLDVSNSMAARDVKPSRLERAKIEIKRLINTLEGNRIGLIAFAGASFVESPLTLDIGATRMILDSMEVGSIPKQGTAIDQAIYEAIKAFNTSKANSKAVILITDGESLTGNVARAAEAAKDEGLKISTIGIGSTSGAPIPQVDKPGGITGYKTDSSGKIILTKLDTETLRTIAETTGGVFYTSQGESLDLTDLIETIQGMEKVDITSFEYTEFEERYIPLAIAALLLLVSEYFYFTRSPAKVSA